MNICGKCGAEFEGRFCPECGTEYAGDVYAPRRTCRKCGAVVTGRFCSECGAEYGARRICRGCGKSYTGSYCPYCGTKGKPSGYGRRLYRGVNAAMPTLYLACTLAAFIACFLPLNKGSFASVLAPDLSNLFAADVFDGAELGIAVFNVVNLVAAAVLFVFGMLCGGKRVGRLSLYQVTGIVGVVLMLACLANGVTLCGMLSDFRYRAARFNADPGACPVTLIASGGLCAVANTVLLSVSSWFSRRDPLYAEAERLDGERLRAVSLSERLAEEAGEGDAEAQFRLGVLCRDGRGFEKDAAEAVRWFAAAAEHGYAPAQGELAKCYEYGYGTDKDPAEALRWYRRSAENGYAPAQCYLGNYCLFLSETAGPGIGGNADRAAEAVGWLEKAADQRDATALERLSECYRKGVGIARDEEKAAELHRMARKAGWR